MEAVLSVMPTKDFTEFCEAAARLNVTVFKLYPNEEGEYTYFKFSCNTVTSYYQMGLLTGRFLCGLKNVEY